MWISINIYIYQCWQIYLSFKFSHGYIWSDKFLLKATFMGFWDKVFMGLIQIPFNNIKCIYCFEEWLGAGHNGVEKWRSNFHCSITNFTQNKSKNNMWNMYFYVFRPQKFNGMVVLNPRGRFDPKRAKNIILYVHKSFLWALKG